MKKSVNPQAHPQALYGLQSALGRYVEYLGCRGHRAQGIESCRYNVSRFIEWALERGVTHPGQISQAILQRYQRHLYYFRKQGGWGDGEPLSVATQATRLTAVRGYFRWLTKQGELPANPAAELELPRLLKRLPRTVLTHEEAQHILQSVDLAAPLGLRDRAILEVLYATGMRRGEVVGLQMGDIEFRQIGGGGWGGGESAPGSEEDDSAANAPNAVVFIREGKGGKDRWIPLGARALYWVQQYLHHPTQGREALAWNQQEHALFLTRSGRVMRADGLTTVVRRHVLAAQVARGVEDATNASTGTRTSAIKTGGCHLWRHSMATLMLEGGADIRHVQAMLGHSDISSTQIYTQVAISQLQRVHARTHPGAQLPQRLSERMDKKTQAPMPTPEPGACNAVDALLEALDEQAQEEAQADGE